MDKPTLRERVWDALEDSGEARFPFPPHGRIPNFAGAEAAARRVADLAEWGRARAVKANPDAPQRPVRERALAAGTDVYMAVPRLGRAECFRHLDPGRIDDPADAVTLSGAEEHGVLVAPADVPPIDLVVVGSVAVTEDGARVGKGEGFSDLEFALLTELGLVDADTTVVTTVHEMQVTREEVPVEAHDVPLDVVVTPERTVRTDTPYDRPDGLDWDALTEERVEELPVLERFRP